MPPVTRPAPVKWQPVHVFVSSTFNDMHAERDYLVKRVFPELQEWCERRKLRLVDIDLRWGVTELDATHNKSVVEVCLRSIDDCRPFFLCLLGQRYGWVPAKQDVSPGTLAQFPALRDEIGQKSVTELEVRHALVSPFRPGVEPARHSFFYFRDRTYLDDLPDQPPLLRETYTGQAEPDAAGRQEALRQLKEKTVPETGWPVRSYRATWQPESATPELALPLACPSVLPENVARWRNQWARCIGREVGEADEEARRFNARLTRGRLGNFRCARPGEKGDVPLAQVVLADLQKAIGERFPDHREAAAEDDLQRELDQHEEFRFLHSQGFIERAGTFAELDGYLGNREERRPFVLTAEGGMGKSALLASWVDRRASESGTPFLVRFIGAGDRSTSIDGLLRSLLRELKDRHHRLTAEIPEDPELLRQAFPGLLQTAGQKGPLVLVLDGLNQLETGLSDLAWLPLTLPDNVKLVVSLRRDDPRAERLLERWRGGDAIMGEVRPFESEADRRRLVDAYLGQYLKQLDEPAVGELVAFPGATNPLFLKVALAELRVFGSFAGLHEQIRRAFGDNPVAAFAGALRRLENDPAYSALDARRVVPLLFGWLAHARRGLTADEQADLLVRYLPGTTDREQARDAVHLHLRQVRPFLARRHGRYDFFYESFKLAALGRYVGDAPGQRRADRWHAMLAGYFAAQRLYVPAGEGQRPNTRKVEELPWQQARALDWIGLEATLSDVDFLQAKCAADLANDLADDYRAAVAGTAAGETGETHNRLTVLARAFALARPIVADLPALVFGQMVPHLQAGLSTRAVAERWIGRRDEPYLTFFAAPSRAAEAWRDVRAQEIPLLTRPLGPMLVDRGGDRVFFLVHSATIDDPTNLLGLDRFTVAELRRSGPEEFRLTTFTLPYDDRSPINLLMAGEDARTAQAVEVLRRNHPGLTDGSGLDEHGITVATRFESNFDELRRQPSVDPDRLEAWGGVEITPADDPSRDVPHCFADNVTAAAALGPRRVVCGSACGELRTIDLDHGPQTTCRVAQLGISKICPVPGSEAFVFASICGILGYHHPDGRVSSVLTPHEHGIRNCVVAGGQVVTVGLDFAVYAWSLDALSRQPTAAPIRRRVVRSYLTPSGRHLAMQLAAKTVEEYTADIEGRPDQESLLPFTSRRARALLRLAAQIPQHRNIGLWYHQACRFARVDLNDGNPPGPDARLLPAAVALAADLPNDAHLTGRFDGPRFCLLLNGKPLMEVPSLGAVIADYYFSPDGRFLVLFFSQARGFVVADLQRRCHREFPTGAEIREPPGERPADNRLLTYRRSYVTVGERRRLVAFSPFAPAVLYYNPESGLCRIDLETLTARSILRLKDPAEGVQCYAFGDQPGVFLLGTSKGLYRVEAGKATRLVTGNFIECGVTPHTGAVWAVSEDGRACLPDGKGGLGFVPGSLALMPAASPSGRYLVLVGVNGLLQLVDLSTRRVALRYGLEGIAPRVHAVDRGLVFAYPDGDHAILTLNRVSDWEAPPVPDKPRAVPAAPPPPPRPKPAAEPAPPVKQPTSTWSFRKDREEFRNWSVLISYADRAAAIKDYPDFDIAYLRAAYPTNRSEDHPNARPEFLRRAIGKVKMESRIHARLSCYHVWEGNYEAAFREAVQYFLMANEVPRDFPGDHTACIVLVAGALESHGFLKEGEQIAGLNPDYELGDREKENVRKALAHLRDVRHRPLVAEAAQALGKAGGR